MAAQSHTHDGSTEGVIEAALDEARDAYDEGVSSMPFGFANLKGLDGRRKETKVLKELGCVEVRTGGYHGTTAHFDFADGQPIAPKNNAYRAFLDFCQDEGLFEEVTVWKHLD